jgi:hypothetical protein
MVLSYVLCMTLMMFIYVYYRLFTCINLVDVMSLFSRFFRSIYRFLAKIVRFLIKFARKSSRRFLKKLADLSVKLPYFSVPGVLLFIHRLRFVSIEFSVSECVFAKFF